MYRKKAQDVPFRQILFAEAEDSSNLLPLSVKTLLFHKTMKKYRLTFFRICSVVLLIACLMTGMHFQSHTLIPDWIPVLAGAVFIVLTFPLGFLHRGWRLLIGSSSPRWLLWICHAAVTGVAGCCLFLTVNYLFVSADTTHTEQAVVTGKKIKEHRTRRRSGRHYHHPTKTRSHYLLLRFANGAQKEFYVPLDTYNHTRTGDSYKVEVSRGALGFPVVRTKLF